MRKRSIIGWGSVLGLSVALPAFGTVIIVPTNQPTIQAAVNVAAAGDTIQVLAGMYRENVVVPAGKDGLQILGANAKTVVVDAQPAAPNGTGPGFFVQSNSVIIASLTVRHAASDGTQEGDGIRCVADRCTLQGVIVIGSEDDDVEIIGNSAMVTQSTMVGSSDTGLVLSGDAAQIVKNVVQNQGDGGYDLTGSNLRVEGNIAAIIEDGEGFRITGNNNLILKNSTSVTDDEGFLVTGDSNSILNNSVATAEGDGIFVSGNVNMIGSNSVETVDDNDGFDIEGDDNTLTQNKVRSVDDVCYELSGNNFMVEKNKAEDCLDDGFVVDGANPRLVGNTADQTVDGDGFDVSCVTDCSQLLVQSNSATGASNDNEGFDISLDVGTGAGWIVEKNTAKGNISHGFAIAASGGVIRNNKAFGNGSEDEEGFSITGDSNQILSNLAKDNEGDGFLIQGSSNTISKNKADRNKLDGIHLGSNFQGSSVSSDQNTLDKNSASKNQADGIRNDGTNTTLTNNKTTGNRMDCTSDLAGNFTGGVPATAAVDTGNMCADGSSFSTTQTAGIHS